MKRWMIFWMLAAALGGCSAPRVNNTRLTSGDLVAMSDWMAASLAAAEQVAGRTAGSAAWVITMEKVSNRTNDILPERERWAFMARLRGQLAQSPLMRERNLQFVMTPEAAAALGARDGAGTERAKPTHALTATFYSITNAAREGRTDAYLCAFQLLDLRTDKIVWEDRYEVKRAVVRNEFD